MKCSDCSGRGEVYFTIGTDKHIAKCASCEGWGTVDKPNLNQIYGKFGAPPKSKTYTGKETVNLDDFLEGSYFET